MTVSAVGRYWVRIVVRANLDTKNYLGSSLKKTVFEAITMLLAVGILAWAESGPQAVGKVEWWAIGLLAAGAVFAVVWVCFLVRAPLAIEEETGKQNKEQADIQLSRISELSAQVIALQSQIITDHSRHQQEKESLEGDVLMEKQVDPHRSAIRSQIDDFISRFEELREAATTDRRISASRVYSLDRDANRYLKNHVPEYPNYIGKFLVPDTYLNNEMLEGQEVVCRCEDRLVKLRKIQDWH